MKNKITTKKIKSVAKDMSNKTTSFVKKANKKAGDIAKTLKQQWKKEQPQRKELMTKANEVFEQGVKIGGDVFETIKKDIKEINSNSKDKK